MAAAGKIRFAFLDEIEMVSSRIGSAVTLPSIGTWVATATVATADALRGRPKSLQVLARDAQINIGFLGNIIKTAQFRLFNRGIRAIGRLARDEMAMRVHAGVAAAVEATAAGVSSDPDMPAVLQSLVRGTVMRLQPILEDRV